MSELSPAELDVIEDLLEGLEDEGVPATRPVEDPARNRVVSRRLDAYRAILRASREALPMQDVPSGVLDGVLAEARRASGSAPSSDRPTPRASWWKRLRGTFVFPAVAFAGTAALLVLVMRPQGEDAATAFEERPLTAELDPPPPTEASADEREMAAPARDARRLADAIENEQAAGAFDADATARGEGALALEEDRRATRSAEVEPFEDAEEEGVVETPKRSKSDDPGDGLFGGAAKKSRKRTSSGSRNVPAKPRPASRPSKDAPAPEPQAPAQNKSEPGGANPGLSDGDDAASWSLVSKGDAQRRAGNCSLARSTYGKVPDAGRNDVRARALAGLGLCEVVQGRPSAADAFFAKARAADPRVGGFIEAELAAIAERE